MTPAPAVPPEPDRPACDTARLHGCLRLAAMRSRLAPRRGAAAPPSPTGAPEAVARDLVKSLPEALGRRVVLHRPGAATLTFDEAWLLRMIGATAAEDRDTLHFALATRVRRDMRGQVCRMAGILARSLDAGAAELT